MNPSKPRPVLFTIDIKLSGQLIHMPVYQDQNHDSLIKRFCDQHLMKSKYQQTVKNKIIQSLLSIIKKAQISATLKNKLNIFLNHNQNHLDIKNKPLLYQHSNTSTPFRLLKQSNQNNSKQSKPHHEPLSKHPATDQQQLPLKYDSKQPIKPSSCIRKNKNQIQQFNNKTQGQGLSNKSLNKLKNHDSDLLIAYQTIYKKSKQPEMMQMAKKFLQQNGYFRHDKSPLLCNKKPHSSNLTIKTSSNKHQSNIEQSSQSKKKQHNKNKKLNKLDHLKKYQTIEPFQISPSPYHFHLQQKSSKKKRIKYNLPEQDDNIQQFSSEKLHANNHYDKNIKYHDEKDSLSYQNAPFNFHQEKYTYNSNPMDIQLQHSVSLRKTRKYKYL